MANINVSFKFSGVRHRQHLRKTSLHKIFAKFHRIQSWSRNQVDCSANIETFSAFSTSFSSRKEQSINGQSDSVHFRLILISHLATISRSVATDYCIHSIQSLVYQSTAAFENWTMRFVSCPFCSRQMITFVEFSCWINRIMCTWFQRVRLSRHKERTFT